VVRIPREDKLRGLTLRGATNRDGERLPCRIVCESDSELSVEVTMSGAPLAGPASFAVYLGTVAQEGVPRAEPDPTPVSLVFFPHSSKSPPNSWDKMLYLYGKGLPAAQTRLAADLSGFVLPTGEPAQAQPDQTGRARRRWDRSGAGRWILRARCSVLCPAGGAYRFAVTGSDPAFLFIDGKMASISTDRYAGGDKWLLGPAMDLGAGLHSLDFFVGCDRETDAAAGWLCPAGVGSADVGPGAVEPLGAFRLLSGAHPDWTRIELEGAAPMPGYHARIQPSYSFRGNKAVFTPVVFSVESHVKPGTAMRLSGGDGWSGALEPGSSAVTHIFAGADRYTSALEISNDCRWVRAMAWDVDLSFAQPVESAASFNLASLPAVCYASDRVEPRLGIETAIRGSVAFRLQVKRLMRGGQEEAWETNVASSANMRFVDLPAFKASDVDTMSWSAVHAGVSLASERVRFAPPPFQDSWFRAEGESLISDSGERFVLVSDRVPRDFPRTWDDPRPIDRVVCYDDILESDRSTGSLLEGMLLRELSRTGRGRSAAVTVERVPDPAGATDACSRLLPLVSLPRRLDSGTDVVVLSIGLQDIRDGRPAREYERTAAALVDLLVATRGCRVVCATLPPYPSRADLAREYAVSMHPVAAARGLPVADLYTVFHTAFERPRDGFSEGEAGLSHSGRGLAARLIAHTIDLAASGEWSRLNAGPVRRQR
jgi:hypothetical protein